MIRNFKVEDTEKLIQFIKKENIVDGDNILSDIESDDKKLIVYDEAGIRGFAYMSVCNKETKRYDVNLYVEAPSRRKGIGTALYNEMSKYVQEIKPNILVTEFSVDKDKEASFYKRLGYKKWFGCNELYYRGIIQPNVDIEFEPYEDKYYDQYVKLVKDCFYELRKENDIQPYSIPSSKQDRENRLKSKDSIYVLFENEQLVASIFVEDGNLDFIMVTPSYQGKGYGKKATQFGINKALSQGAKLIQLGALEWNTKAIALYESIGFEIVQTVHFYRQFGEK
ncbi:GNAT family N-acetyltransferase [Clostridium tagluense]|uniref:GNAT family N-acetyltransferase n=2 Tax=Clostridium tagluense TaxID=360422 RepID=UPI0027147819|nr:GNAT family N-acetyltransferase [Clostridium tagluense]WLC66787.1 GNAT family N-acetyltransferase [Clostridium tagluense]